MIRISKRKNSLHITPGRLVMINNHIKLTIALLLLCLFGVLGKAQAESTIVASKESFYKARILDVPEQGEINAFGLVNPFQTVRLLILEGDLNGKELTLEHGKNYNIDKNQLVSVGQTVVVSALKNPDGTSSYQIVDVYRLDQVSSLIIIFFVGIVLLSGFRGLGAIAGMLVSLGVIVLFIIPQLLLGKDPLMVSITGCFIIMVLTIYLAHGVSKQTTLALISTFISLVFTGLLATFAVHIAHLTGLGNEEAYGLKLGPTSVINLRGLLLGGILIGTLGVLDDVTTGLTSSVFELAKANPKLTFSRLLSSGLTIGREHITSLVNTLVLAYAGASMPVFLTILVNPNQVPLWVIFNSEIIMEEVVRTLSGSIGLVLAVPLSAFLASYYVTRKQMTHGKGSS